MVTSVENSPRSQIHQTHSTHLLNPFEEQKWVDLKQHIGDLVNPFLVQDILDELKKVTEELIDPTSNIFESLLHELSLPPETLHLIQQFGESLKDWTSTDSINEKVSAIKKELSAFTTTEREVLSTWEPLELLLKIPQFKALDNSKIQTIFHLIQSGNTPNLRDFVRNQCFAPDVYEAIDQSLENSDYEDLATLIAQITDQKPAENEGVLFHKDKPPEFFVGKTLYINDPDIIHSHSRTIIQAEKLWYSPNFLKLSLEDRSEVAIDVKTGEVKLTKTHTYPFWKAINSGIITISSYIRPLFSPSSHYGAFSIPDDIYWFYEESSDEKWTSWFTSQILEKLIHFPSLKVTNFCFSSMQAGIVNRFKLAICYIPDSSQNIHQVEKIYIYRWNPRKNKYNKNGVEIPGHEFMKNFIVEKQEKIPLTAINLTNIDQHVLLKDERDESKIKLFYLQEAQEEKAAIQRILMDNQHQTLLVKLLDELTSHPQKEVGIGIVKQQDSDLEKRIQDLSKKYRDHLDMKRSPSEIITQLLLEINYMKLVPKEQSVGVLRTMELLKGAYQHIKEVEKKDVVLFFGNTGSGKSSAICYFLKAKMESFINHVGDRVIRVQPGQDKRFPTIGQSLGESETLYTSIYPTETEGTVLGDCPGFCDTRGDEYEICTNLSIDQAVEKARRIHSIVVTIPIHNFLADRANGVIDVIETVRERFPFAFDLENPEMNKHVYVLITKQQQAPNETVQKLKNGNRIRELLKEAQESSLKEIERMQGKTLDDFQLRSLERRKRTWESLSRMHTSGQIDLIDIEDKFARKKLLAKYQSPKGTSHIDKSEYVKAMEGGDMQRKFGKKIEMAVDTWTTHIFPQYLDKIPQDILKKEEDLDKAVKELEDHKQAFEANNKKLNELRSKQADFEALPKITFESSELDASIPEDVRNRFEALRDERLSELKEEIEELEKTIENKRTSFKEKESEVQDYQNLKTKHEDQIRKLEAEISDLSKGAHEVLLESIDYREKNEQMMTLRTWKSSARREELFLEGKEPSADEFVDFREVKIGDYRGELSHEVYIEKEYRIAPVDPKIRKLFQQSIKANRYTAGRYEAKLDGAKFEPDLGMIADPTGKKVRYGFKTLWDGKQMPWIKIVHTIPNSDYNEATIINKQGQINHLKEEIAKFTAKLEGAEGIEGLISRKDKIQETIQDLEKEKTQKETEQKTLGQEKLAELIDKMIQEIKDEISKRETNHPTLQENIQKAEVEQKAIETQLEQAKKTKKRLALAIYHEWETGKLLSEFAQLAIDGEDNTIRKEREAMTQSCLEFIEAFNENQEKVEQEFMQDLGLAQ